MNNEPYEDLDRADYETSDGKLHITADWFVDNLVAVIDKGGGYISEIYDSASNIVLYDDEGYISKFDAEEVPVEAVICMEAQYGRVTYLSDHVDIKKGDL